MNDDLMWKLGTFIASVAGAWATMRAEVKHLRERVKAVEDEQDSWRSVSLQLAGAVNTIASLDKRLERIEDKVDDLYIPLASRPS